MSRILTHLVSRLAPGLAPGHVLRRALAQRRALAGVVVLTVAATTLLGVCTMLLGPTQDRAFLGGVRLLEPADVGVTAYAVDLAASDLVSTSQDAAALVREVLAPLDPTLTSDATSRMRRLDTGDGLGYLATGDEVRAGSRLTSGTWPAAPTEAAVPEAAAQRLGVGLGDRVVLGPETGLDGSERSVDVVVVGTFRTTAEEVLAGDPLAGAGYDSSYSDGTTTLPAFGPFVVTTAGFVASGSHVAGLQVTGHPDLTSAGPVTDGDAARAALQRATDDLTDGSSLLAARIGDRARITRLASTLPTTLEQLQAQTASTRSTVLVVLLVTGALALAALVLSGRLLAAVREDERVLLVGMGLSRAQQLRSALGEAALVAVVTAALSVPAVAVVHAGLTHLAPMAAAGLAQPPRVTGVLVLTVVVAAVLLSLALVAPALRRDHIRGGRRRRRLSASLVVDVLLLVIVVAAARQLRGRSSTPQADVDVVLTLAPLVCLVAASALVVRRVPLLLELLSRRADRADSLVLPLAVHQSARRPQAGLALVLLATAAASATFAMSLQATWMRSQHDQADLRVGTDLALTLPGPATAEDAAAVADAVTGGRLSPVASPPVTLGRFVGERGAGPVLLAVDTASAGSLLRGRVPGSSWAEVGAALEPPQVAGGIDLPRGAPVGGAGGSGRTSLQGRAPARTALTATATAVVEDDTGFRRIVAAAPVALDGVRHRVRWLDPLGPGRVVAVDLRVGGPAGAEGQVPVAARLEVDLHLPGSSAGGWQVRPLGRDTPVRGATVEAVEETGGTLLRTRAQVDLGYLSYSDAELVATAFAPAPDVPVAISQQLAQASGSAAGTTLSGIVGDASVRLRVVAVVPAVPSAPDRPAVLADQDLLSRALIASGHLEPVVEAWWVADPSRTTVSSLRATGLGEVTTPGALSDALARGPLRVTTPTALALLAGAGSLLLLIGCALVAGAEPRRRAVEVTRLRALGLTSRESRRLLLAEHAILVAPLVVLGSVVGAAASAALGPPLVRSDRGSAPVPHAVLVWPWVPELLLVTGFLAGCTAVAAVVAVTQVRRSDPALLRTDES